MTKQKKWTEAEKQRLRRMCVLGMNRVEIAEALDRTVHSVDRMRHMIGATRPRRPWTPREDEQLIGYAKDGFPLSELAQQLGRSRFALHERLKKLGVRHRLVGRNRDIDLRSKILTAIIGNPMTSKHLAAVLGRSHATVCICLREAGEAGILRYSAKDRKWHYAPEVNGDD